MAGRAELPLGATAEGEIHSLASDLVYAGGFPAVVGMREPIASDDASQFSGRFYPVLIEAVGGNAGGRLNLDWSGMLVGPRRRLIQLRGGVFSATAAKRHEWTPPVLYLRPEEFQVGSAPTPQATLSSSRSSRPSAGRQRPARGQADACRRP